MTLAEANARRPVALFEDLLSLLLGRLDGRTAGKAWHALRILDSTVISPPAKMNRWAAFRANNAGLKLHLAVESQ